jgi:hypothetical protein
MGCHFGRLWYGEPNAVSYAVDYAKFRSRSHDAVIRVYDESGEVSFDCQTVNDPAASHRRFLHMRWLAFAIYLAVGVALWRSWPWFRNTFHEAGYVGGMILTALIWPLALMMVAGIMVFFLVGWLLEKLFRLFRHKQ